MELPTPESREKAAEELIASAVALCREKYGDLDFPGEDHRPYHNAVHAREVLDSATQIGKLALGNGKITPDELILLRIAAPFHDVEYSLGANLNEDESGEIAAGSMLVTGQFSKEEAERVRRLIQATKAHMVDGVFTQEPTDDYLTKIICDADWNKFGTPFEVFWGRSLDFLREIAKTDSPTPEQTRLFAQEQLHLISHHSFYSAEANVVFPHKADNIIRTQQLIDDYTE